MPLLLPLVLPVLSSCHPGVTRMVAHGRYDDAIERASTRKFEVRDGSARAYARALAERGRYEEARGILLRDFRRGQHFESLDALAALELKIGARGVAAVHFAKLMELDVARLRGREEVCQLFRERARAFLAQDEAIAADQDLRRVYELCSAPTEPARAHADRVLARRIAPAAASQARALRALSRGEAGSAVHGSRESRRLEFEAERDRELALGLGSYGRWAAATGTSLHAEEIVAILIDEFQDPGRGELFSLHEIEVWAGAQSLESIVQSAIAGSEADAGLRAYVQVRLAPLAQHRGEDMVLHGLEKAELEVLTDPLDASSASKMARAWKALALSGQDLAAELVLLSWLRSKAPEADAERSPEPAVDALIGAQSPWWERVQIDAETLGPIMALGHLLEARGESLRALEIWTAVGLRAQKLGIREAAAYFRREARRQLRGAHPWRALAIAEFAGVGNADLRAAAETQFSLIQVLCRWEGNPVCESDSDRLKVERVMTSEWVRARRRAMFAQRPARKEERDACLPGSEELTIRDSDATGHLFMAVRDGAEASRSADISRILVSEFEADLSLGCGAGLRVDLLYHLLSELSISTLSERLTQATVQRASRALETKAALALAEGLEDRAWELTRAAAGDSPDPVRVMERAARRGRAWGKRNYELSARLRIIELNPAQRWGSHARAILRLRFGDFENSELLVGGYEVAREAWLEDFSRHLAAFNEARRASEARRLVSELWADVPVEPARQARAQARLVEIFGSVQVESVLNPPAKGDGEVVMRGGYGTSSPISAGRIIVGSASERTRAQIQLLKHLSETGGLAARAELVDLLLEGGSAVDDEGDASTLVVRDDLAWRFALGLPVDASHPEP